MAKKYSRTELIAYLRAIRAKGEPIVVAGAGSTVADDKATKAH